MSRNDNVNEMHPGARQLERVAFEDSPVTTEIRLVHEHLQTCAVCKMQVETLRAGRDAFLMRVPPNVFFASLSERDDRAKADSALLSRLYVLKRPLLAFAATIVLAGLVALVVRFKSKGEALPGAVYPEISLKGQAADAVGLSLFVSRDGKDAVPWVKNEPLWPGDVLKFGIYTQKSGYVTVVNIDDRGTLSIYYPTASNGSERIVEGKTTVLSGSIIMDDFVGEELLIAFVTPKPGDVKRLGDAVLDAYRLSGNQFNGLRVKTEDAENGMVKIRKVKP